MTTEAAADRLWLACRDLASLTIIGTTKNAGKTTTLHSVLGFLNTPDTKIWTAEDPVEITQKGLRQVQVNKKAGLDFAAVMKALSDTGYSGFLSPEIGYDAAREPGHLDQVSQQLEHILALA
mgnify:CR=1 FL=1